MTGAGLVLIAMGVLSEVTSGARFRHLGELSLPAEWDRWNPWDWYRVLMLRGGGLVGVGLLLADALG
ncbi:MAG: hypothetical protein ACOYXM_06075 [Actinomycetota bacterium]